MSGGDRMLAVVIGDFGRSATFRFCAALTAAEQQAIVGRLPAGARFYDEHRRITIALTADLPFVKAEVLSRFVARGQNLDDTVLVGFPGGPSMQLVAARIGLLLLEAMAGPVARGCRRANVMLPCNTLAPASRWLAERFTSASGIAEVLQLAATDAEHTAALQDVGSAIIEQVTLRFPTVPEAVLQIVEAGGASGLVVLGTEEAPKAYAEAATRCHSPLELLTIEPPWQQAALDAIGAAVADDAAARQRAKKALERVRLEVAARHGPNATIVEACTDLDYHVGLDSTAAYATALVREVYSV